MFFLFNAVSTRSCVAEVADKICNLSLVTRSGGASAAKKPGHFEVRTSSSQVTRMHFFPPKKLTTFLVQNTKAANATNKAVSGQIW